MFSPNTLVGIIAISVATGITAAIVSLWVIRVLRKILAHKELWSALTNGALYRHPWENEKEAVYLRKLLQPKVDVMLAVCAKKLEEAYDKSIAINNERSYYADEAKKFPEDTDAINAYRILGYHQAAASRMVKEIKESFWGLHRSASAEGFTVHQSYKDYLKATTVPEVIVTRTEDARPIWYASLKSDPDVVSAGNDLHRVLGNFMIEHQEIIGMKVTIK